MVKCVLNVLAQSRNEEWADHDSLTLSLPEPFFLPHVRAIVVARLLPEAAAVGMNSSERNHLAPFQKRLQEDSRIKKQAEGFFRPASITRLPILSSYASRASAPHLM